MWQRHSPMPWVPRCKRMDKDPIVRLEAVESIVWDKRMEDLCLRLL